MAGSKSKLQPRDIVWFKDEYDDLQRATVLNKPFMYNGIEHVEVIYIDGGSKKVTIVPVDGVSESVGTVPDILSNKEKFIKKLKGFKKMKLSRAAIITLVVFGFLGIMSLWLAGNYNSLVHARNAVNNSKAKIDTKLTERYDKIDNIVESVKGSQAQESEVFGKIAEARKIGGSTTNPEQQSQANAAIDTQIALLPKLQEAYPELRSNDNVKTLIADLQNSAGGIRQARDEYNNTATNYNNNVSSFPKNMFAGIFNFDQAKLFEASAQEKVNPKVDFSKKEQ